MAYVVVRYKTKPGRGDENQALVEQVFAELAEAEPDGLRYATFRLEDGETFVHVASIETEDGSNPLAATEAFQAFQAELADRCEEQPAAQPATVVGTYNLLP